MESILQHCAFTLDYTFASWNNESSYSQMSKNLLVHLGVCPLSTATKGALMFDRFDELVASVQVQAQLHFQKIILPAGTISPCAGSLNRDIRNQGRIQYPLKSRGAFSLTSRDTESIQGTGCPL